MASAKKLLVAGAAAAVLAAGGSATVIPSSAAAASVEGSVGSVFSGTIEIASTTGILVERRQRKGISTLVSVDTDRQTVVSREGQALSVEDLAPGAEVIVSGTKTSDGGVLASKILIRS